MTNAGARLPRRLGLGDAVVIGLASMIGAGVFAVFAPAAQAAGGWMLLAIAVAALIAWANASSTAQLAATTPVAGGVYRYGRDRLGPWPGFLAGWGFVVGKTASCAAMAMTFAAYVLPGFERGAAVVAVVAVVGVNLLGITRTARAAAIIVAIVGAVLALVLVGGAIAVVGTGVAGGVPTGGTASGGVEDAPDWFGVLQAAGLVFFAFAGYARVATLGEEVRDPTRTIPRAIGIAFAIVVVAYLLLGAVALASLGASDLASSTAPLVDVATAGGWAWTAPVVQVGAALACLGALLALVAGISRTALAMARDHELPTPLARIHAGTGVPWVAELSVGVGVVALVLVGDLREVIGFSSFGVLGYYLVANLAAWTMAPGERRYPRWTSAAGAIGCLVLAATLPWPSVVGGLVVFALGAVGRVVVTRSRAPTGGGSAP